MERDIPSIGVVLNNQRNIRRRVMHGEELCIEKSYAG